MSSFYAYFYAILFPAYFAGYLLWVLFALRKIDPILRYHLGKSIGHTIIVRPLSIWSVVHGGFLWQLFVAGTQLLFLLVMCFLPFLPVLFLFWITD